MSYSIIQTLDTQLAIIKEKRQEVKEREEIIDLLRTIVVAGSNDALLLEKLSGDIKQMYKDLDTVEAQLLNAKKLVEER